MSFILVQNDRVIEWFYNEKEVEDFILDECEINDTPVYILKVSDVYEGKVRGLEWVNADISDLNL